MGIVYYLKAAGIYLAGIVIIACGLILFFNNPSSSITSTSFCVMFIGLAVSMVGGVYGKKRLRSQGSRKPGPPIKWPWQRRGKKQASTRETRYAEKKVETEKDVRVVKVLICPFCSEENKYNAVFCYKCGRKLRK